MSRIGKKPISVPEKVKITVSEGRSVAVEGPRGKLSWRLPQEISLEESEKEITLNRSGEQRRVKALHGLSRSLIQNMITGVDAGFKKELEINGVGFRAALQGKTLNMSLGKSHPINFSIPEEITVTVADNTKVTVEGIDKQKVGQVAADIRKFYPPEPYKGKGIKYAGEQIRRKEGKSVQ